MSEKHTKSIVDAVEQSDVYVKAMSSVPDDEKPSVQATLQDFAELLGPVFEALEQLEQDDEVAKAVRERLAEKLRGG